MINKPRKWWIAGLLSLLRPGLGQIYNGQARKGLLFLAISILVSPAMMSGLTDNLIFFLGAILSFELIYRIIVVTDAISTAKKLRFEYQLKSFNRTVVYIGILVLVLVTNTGLAAFIKYSYVQAYKIPAGSMEPTLLVGDHILVDRRPSARNPHRGDIIVFEFPADPKKDYVKRVVAAGGDTVEIRDKKLFVNGELANETYTFYGDPRVIQSPRDNYGPTTIPANSYFVMGDNRDHSYDSRFWGVVPKSKIRGTVRSIYWSWDSTNNTVRWNRIGALGENRTVMPGKDPRNKLPVNTKEASKSS